MNVLIIPSWYPGKSDSLLGVYHKDYAKALSKYENVNIRTMGFPQNWKELLEV